MNSSFLCLVLLSAVCCALSLRPECESHVVEDCNNQRKSLYDSRDGPIIVKSESELHTLCVHQQRAMTCLKNYVDTCQPEEKRIAFKNMTSGDQDVVFDLCNPQSRTRKVYLKHLSCYIKVSDDVHHCKRKLDEWNKHLRRSEAIGDQELREFCCRYEHTMSCVLTVVRDGCPGEAADLIDEMVEKATKQTFLTVGCSNYNYVVSECNASSTLFASILPLASLICVVLTVFNKF